MSQTLKNLSDEVLIQLYQKKKNTETAGILYDRYAHLVYGVCLKYLKNTENAKEALSQIFEKLLSDLEKHTIQNFKAWIYRVAQNHCYMILRTNNHLIQSVDIFPTNIVENDDGKHHLWEKEKKYEQMQEALANLPTEQKQCIALFYIENKSYQEIMEATGYSFMQVKSNIQNGKRNLKIKMNHMTIDE